MIRALLAGLLLTGALAPAAAPATAPAAGSVVGVGAEPGSCAELAPAEPRAVVRLPVPTGPFPVGTRSFVVTDEAREDPFLPGSHRPRQLMVQAWYPARSTVGLRPARYVTARTAAQLDAAYGLPGAYEGVRTNAFAGAPAAEERGGRPVVIYSPGGGETRASATAAAEELASRGYVVLGVDHTYVSPAVEFPGGRLVCSAARPADWPVNEEYRVAAADLRSVVDELGARPLPYALPCLDLDRIAAIGHSFGGIAVAEALRTDPRFRAGVTLDGPPVTLGEAGLRQPFLPLTTAVDFSWPFPEQPGFAEAYALFREHQRAWGRQIVLPRAGHNGLTDTASFTGPWQLREQLPWPPEVIDWALGTSPDDRAVHLVRAFLTAFADEHLRGGQAPVLDEIPPAWAEDAVLVWRAPSRPAGQEWVVRPRNEA